MTALLSAAARAAHPLVDRAPFIFVDPLAERLLGDRGPEMLGYQRGQSGHPVMSGARAQTVCRSRYVEDRVAAAVRAGVGQYVILGAGLDSYAYRPDAAPTLTVFEVDAPGTQRWKRGRLADAGVPEPPSVRYVPADLGADPLTDRLRAAGFDPDRPAVVSWLGVSMYLDRAGLDRTVSAVGGMAPGTELMLDYFVPAALRDRAGQEYVEMIAAAVRAQGEPWRTFLTPDEVGDLVAAHGLTPVEDVSQRDMVEPRLWARDDALCPTGLLRMARARVGAG